MHAALSSPAFIFFGSSVCTSSSSSAERFFGDAAGPDSNHFFTAACCSAVRLAKPLRSSRLSSPRFGFFWHSMWRHDVIV